MNPMRVCIVTLRYGDDIVGGAEQLLRHYAEALAERGHNVRVLTTCARNHHTWANELPAGKADVNGIEVWRFPVSVAPDLELVGRLHAGIEHLNAPLQETLLRNKGYSQPLFDEIKAVRDDVDIFVFGPYLFPLAVYGARVVPEKSVVLTALHDEPYARFAAVHETLRGVRSIIALTPEEVALLDHVVPEHAPAHVVGAGFDISDVIDPKTPRGRSVVYAGRLEGGKNYPLLVEWVAEYNRLPGGREPLTLQVMGSGDYRPPSFAEQYVSKLGFVSEARRADVMSSALAVANLSLNESFSFVLMESWLAGTPVIVHADCPVTRGHCERSGGGLWVSDGEEFAAAVDLLASQPDLAARMARAGAQYVKSNYSWGAVIDRLESALRASVGAAA